MNKFLKSGTTLLFAIGALTLLGGMESFRTPLLENALIGEHRTEDEQARDIHRHPTETLAFFGLDPDMHVAEIWPGGRGWYLKVIAPTLAGGSGEYYAVTPWDPASENERVQKAIENFNTNFVANKDTYGTINVSLMRGLKTDIAPASSLDMVLTFRNVHNWMTGNPDTDYSAEYMAGYFRALKPGGILGIVEHRADPEAPIDAAASSGYVHESQVMAMAEAAGFEFVAKSDINANAKDTRDHPYGVWTLPPTLRSAGRGQDPNPEFDHAPYNAIGESDRMTMKFRKPIPASK